MRKRFAAIVFLAAALLLFAGCRRKSAGLYTAEEMAQIHDITVPVARQVTAYHNVIEGSLPVTLSGRISDDPNYIEELALMRIDPNKPMIALTYDDGPRAESTKAILDTLEQYNAKATFFVVGSNVTDQNREILKRMASMGCEVGSHTYDHTDLTTYDAESMKADLDKTKAVIEDASGKPCTLMRPPGGAMNDYVAENIEYPMIIWYLDTRDWESRYAPSVISNVEEYACDGAIVLMHDIYDSTAAASAEIIPWLDAHDYQMVTVSQLAALRGIKLEAGKAYYDFLKTSASEDGTDASAEGQGEGSYEDGSSDGASYEDGSSDNGSYEASGDGEYY